MQLFKVTKKLNHGFTLIEILVVVALISIMVSASLAAIDPISQIQKANDARRKADLESLQRALELYYQDNGRYPANTATTYEIIDNGTVNWGNSWAPYMSKVPKDSPPYTYVYFSPGGANANQSYFLYAHLERGGQDPQACNGGLACSSFGTNGPPNSAKTACNGTCNYGVSSSNVSP